MSFPSQGETLAGWHFTGDGDGFAGDRGRPCVVMAHGIGGTRDSGLQPFAENFASAGLDVLLFDYRGWGDSDCRMMLTGARPAAAETFTGEMRELRGYVDPGEQSEDWFNAISYAATNPMVDAGRIGLRGSDLSGGYVLYAAAHDLRVKALVSQVTWADLRPSKPYQPDPARVVAEADAAASRITAGQAPYPADRARVVRVEAAVRVGRAQSAEQPRSHRVERVAAEPATGGAVRDEHDLRRVRRREPRCEGVGDARRSEVRILDIDRVPCCCDGVEVERFDFAHRRGRFSRRQRARDADV